jgi:hypothetical protein
MRFLSAASQQPACLYGKIRNQRVLLKKAIKGIVGWGWSFGGLICGWDTKGIEQTFNAVV